jgi:hypothetical protein
MEELLLHILAEKGLTVDRKGRLVRSASSTAPGEITDEQIRYCNERRGSHDVEARQRYNWVANLAQVVDKIAQSGEAADWPYLSLFWMRLHGLIAEMRSDWLDSLRAMGIDPSTYTPSRGSLLAGRIELLRAIDAVVAALSEDERIYADYRRQTEGHPTQDSYAVRWNKQKAKINDRRTIPTIGRQFAVAELDAAVRRVFAQYRHASGRSKEDAIAVAFARKVQEPLQLVLAIMRRDFLPT